jgi:hypothetical protein
MIAPSVLRCAVHKLPPFLFFIRHASCCLLQQFAHVHNKRYLTCLCIVLPCVAAAGMIVFGVLGDAMGRRWGSRIVASIMLSGTILLTFSPLVPNPATFFNFYIFAATWCATQRCGALVTAVPAAGSTSVAAAAAAEGSTCSLLVVTVAAIAYKMRRHCQHLEHLSCSCCETARRSKPAGVAVGNLGSAIRCYAGVRWSHRRHHASLLCTHMMVCDLPPGTALALVASTPWRPRLLLSAAKATRRCDTGGASRWCSPSADR